MEASVDSKEFSRGICILLVEDNDIIRLCMRSLLESYECDVVSANTGEEALERFDQHIDGVLMDIGLPGMDGYATTCQLRQSSHGREIPIYACSAFDRDIEPSCIRAGMNGFIQKPCRRNEVENFLHVANKKNGSEKALIKNNVI